MQTDAKPFPKTNAELVRGVSQYATQCASDLGQHTGALYVETAGGTPSHRPPLCFPKLTRQASTLHLSTPHIHNPHPSCPSAFHPSSSPPPNSAVYLPPYQHTNPSISGGTTYQPSCASSMIIIAITSSFGNTFLTGGSSSGHYRLRRRGMARNKRTRRDWRGGMPV